MDCPIYTAKIGTNADLFPDVLNMYLKKGNSIADVTYGKGVFWKNINESEYDLLKSDLNTGIDLTNLPYCDNSLDGFVLDPPYAHSSKTPLKSTISDQYNLNVISGRENIFNLYREGICEAHRILKKEGILIIKCQDEIESGKQHWNHIRIINYAESSGFLCMDLFVLVQKGKPAMRHKHQIHARKNHSYFLIFRKNK